MVDKLIRLEYSILVVNIFGVTVLMTSITSFLLIVAYTPDALMTLVKKMHVLSVYTIHDAIWLSTGPRCHSSVYKVVSTRTAHGVVQPGGFCLNIAFT